MMTRTHNKHGDGLCRVCGLQRESLQHFTRCCFVGEVFTDLRALTKVEVKDEKEKERYDLFLIRPDMQKESEGWTYLHLLLWKQVIAALVRVDTEAEDFVPASVWKAAWRRFTDKAGALEERARTKRRRRLARGDLPDDFSKVSSPTAPLAHYKENGTLEWDQQR